jgi:hypothetical protein
MGDVFPSNLEVLFQVPRSVCDEDLRAAVEQLAETLKADLVATGAPVEVVMEASVAVSQYAKHIQASRLPFGRPGAYADPGSERAMLSGIRTSLADLRQAMFSLRVIKTNPEEIRQAIEARDHAFARCAERLFKVCRDQDEPLDGEELMFFVQNALFPLLQEEGLVQR